MILLLFLVQLAEPAIDCADAQTQTAMTICAGRAYDAADTALNEQWSATAAIMRERDAVIDSEADERPGYFTSLLEAQRAWLAYRDAHCRLTGYDARGGSMEPMIVNACLEQVTLERTKQLRQLTVNQVSGEPRGGV